MGHFNEYQPTKIGAHSVEINLFYFSATAHWFSSTISTLPLRYTRDTVQGVVVPFPSAIRTPHLERLLCFWHLKLCNPKSSDIAELTEHLKKTSSKWIVLIWLSKHPKSTEGHLDPAVWAASLRAMESLATNTPVTSMEKTWGKPVAYHFQVLPKTPTPCLGSISSHFRIQSILFAYFLMFSIL